MTRRTSRSWCLRCLAARASRGGLFVDYRRSSAGTRARCSTRRPSRVLGFDRDEKRRWRSRPSASPSSAIASSSARRLPRSIAFSTSAASAVARRARRSRRVVDAVRRRGARLQLPPTSRSMPWIAAAPSAAIRCATSPGGAGGRDLPVRRGAAFRAASRAPSSPRGAEARSRRRAGWRRSSGAVPPRASADRSGDTHVPGVADLGEPRADGLATFSRRRRGALLAHARLVVITFHSLEDRIVKPRSGPEADAGCAS